MNDYFGSFQRKSKPHFLAILVHFHHKLGKKGIFQKSDRHFLTITTQTGNRKTNREKNKKQTEPEKQTDGQKYKYKATCWYFKVSRYFIFSLIQTESWWTTETFSLTWIKTSFESLTFYPTSKHTPKINDENIR